MGRQEMDQVLELFKANSIEYKIFEHEPVYTSEQASKVRNVELKTGVKAMLLRAKDSGNYLLADLAADRKVDFAKLEKLANSRHLRFANRDEVISKTNCEPGSVHPIGRLFGVETFLDNSVLENEFVNFNIGLLTASVKISSRDLFKVLEPEMLADFSKL